MTVHKKTGPKPAHLSSNPNTAKSASGFDILRSAEGAVATKIVVEMNPESATQDSKAENSLKSVEYHYKFELIMQSI